MSFFRKLVRVLAKALVFFASIHLIILVIHAVRSNEWEALSMSSIMDIRYLYNSVGLSSAIEGGLWLGLALFLGYFWFNEKRHK